MKTLYKIALGIAAGAGCLSMMWAQAPKGLTARELFYTAPAKPAAAAKPPAPAVKAATASTKAPTVAKAKTTHSPVVVADSAPASLPGGGHLTAVGLQAATPLGLRYSILKYSGDDQYIEVDPDIVFRSGDKIRLRVQVNTEAYLYVVLQGSSGAWRVMFPSAEFAAGSNHVLPGQTYDLPGNTRLVFDEQAGAEKLFLVLSRTPQTQLDQLIYDLERRPVGGTPAAQPPAGKTLMASAAIGDPLVRNLRSAVQARDLVFEKVDKSKPAPKQAAAPAENAVYVVNASTAADSRLVADVTLQHR